MKCLLSLLLPVATSLITRAQPATQPDFTLSVKIARSSAPLACSPDGRFFAIADRENDIRIYDWPAKSALATRLTRLAGHEAPIVALAFKTADTLVSLSLDQTVKTWAVGSGKLDHSHELNAGKLRLAVFVPGNEPLLAGAISNRVRLWNYDNGALLGSLDANDSDVSSLAVTPDGKLLVIGTTKGVIRVWDVATRKLVRIVDMDSPIHSVAASSSQIAVGYGDGTVDFLNPGEQTSVPEITAHAHAVSALAFSPKGERVASGAFGETVKVWDSHMRKLLCTLAGNTNEILSIVFSPDGRKVMAVGANGAVCCWTIR